LNKLIDLIIITNFFILFIQAIIDIAILISILIFLLIRYSGDIVIDCLFIKFREIARFMGFGLIGLLWLEQDCYSYMLGAFKIFI
jgi:hypothetical protein